MVVVVVWRASDVEFSSLIMKQVKKRVKMLTATEEKLVCEDAYCYRGEACLIKESVEKWEGKLVSDSSGFSLDESGSKSKRATRNTFKRQIGQ